MRSEPQYVKLWIKTGMEEMANAAESDTSFKEKAGQLEEENKKLRKKIDRLKKTMEITSKHSDIVTFELEEKIEASIKVIGETIPVPVKITSITGGKIMYANEHLCRVFGLSSEEILRRNASELYHTPDDRQTFIRQLSEHGRVNGFEVKLKKNDNKPLWGALFSQMLTFRSEPCVLTVIYDLTERRKAEDEIRRLKEYLNQKEIKYLMFTLDGAEYGIEILKVRKIIPVMPITPVPDAPPYVAGMISLGGRVIPVINLRLRLGLPAAECTEQSCIIATASGNDEKSETAGIIVDTVTGVRGIKAKDIEPPSELNLKTDTRLILGIANSDSGLKIIIQPAYINYDV